MKLSKFCLHKIGCQLVHLIFRWTSAISSTTTDNLTTSSTCCCSIDSTTASPSTISHLSWSARYSTVLFNQWNEIRTTKDASSLFISTIFESRLNVFIENSYLLRSTFVAFTLSCWNRNEFEEKNVQESNRLEKLLTVNCYLARSLEKVNYHIA